MTTGHDLPTLTVLLRRSSPTVWVLGGILLAGALVRGLYLGEIAQHPDFTTPGVDAGTHQYWARGLATGDWTPPDNKPDPQISTTPYVRPPGYPYFLAGIYALAGTGAVAPRVVQMGLGLVNCVLAFAIGRRWYGPAVGLTWSAFMSLYWAFIYFEGELQAAVLLISLLLSVVYLLGRWTERLTPAYAVVAGALVGLAALARPNALPILLVVPPWMVLVARRRGSTRKGAIAAAALVLCAVAGVVPATARNYLVARDFVLISANGGINLFIGNNPMATGRPSAHIPGLGRFANCYDYPALVAALERKTGGPMKYSQVSSHFQRQATEHIKDHPLAFLARTVKKALLFWGPWEIANNKEVHYERVFSRVLSRLPGDFPTVLALAVTGGSILFIPRRKRFGDSGSETGPRERRRAIALLMVLIVIALFLAVLPFFVCARYRVPLIPFLLFFGAYGACCLARFIAARCWVSAATCVLGWVGGHAVFSLPMVPGGPDLFRWHYDRGTAYSRLGDADRALAEYEEANRIAADVPLARLGAARLLLRQGKAAQAADHLRYILRYVHPHLADTHHTMAQVLVAQGRLRQAVVHYRESLRIQPGATAVRMELAGLLRRLGDAEEAVTEYERLLMVEPDNVDALFRLGLTLRDAGRYAEANQRLLEAVRAEPGRRKSLEALGIGLDGGAQRDDVTPFTGRKPPSVGELLRRADQLAAVGRTHQATQLYEQALSLKPNHPIIHFKLAEALASDGQLEEAVAQYRRALQADPDFAAAHIGLGMAYGHLDDAESAARHYRAAARIEPDNLAAHYNLGIVLGDGLGRYAEAIEVLDKALVLTESTERADLAERVSDRIERFRAALAVQSGGDSD